MKNLILITVLFTFTSVSSNASLDPRIKALGTMALYGTAGGALLGTASLAFGSGGRSVAKGASLGLYAGIVFGSYVVISHALKQRRMNNPKRDGDYYPDSENSYEEEGPSSLFGSIKGVKGQEWSARNELQEYREFAISDNRLNNTDRNKRLDFFLPVINMQF
jgi:hypothetical protein